MLTARGWVGTMRRMNTPRESIAAESHTRTASTVRDDVTSYDDPGWYTPPEGTRARKV